MARHIFGSILVLGLFVFTFDGAAAEEPPALTFGEVARWTSKVLGEERRLNVLLPPGYHGGTERYPVLYLLDGAAEEDYFHAAGLVDFLATYGVIPPTIVVGISNVDRKRDFTPPTANEEEKKALPTSGGAAKFITFLEGELVPYVEAHYRTAGARTLVGQSLGGLLAAQVLLEKPSLFDQYVIISPSLWWDGQSLVRGAAEKIRQNRAAGRAIYLSVAEEPDDMKATAEKLASLLAADRWQDQRFCFQHLPTETHATSHHLSLYRALEFFYRGRCSS